MAFQKTKIDPELGRRIHKHLIDKGVETPLNENNLYKETKDKIFPLSMFIRTAALPFV